MSPEARLVELIEIVTSEGDGTPANPKRLVTSYFRPDGTMVAVVDRYEPKPAQFSKPAHGEKGHACEYGI